MADPKQALMDANRHILHDDGQKDEPMEGPDIMREEKTSSQTESFDHETLSDISVAQDVVSSSSLSQLPPDILLDIMDYCRQGQLWQASFSMYQLSNDVERRVFYTYFGNAGFDIVQQLAKLPQCRKLIVRSQDEPTLPISWRSWTKLLLYDWCFFGPDNITDLDKEAISPATGPRDPTLNHGIWRLVQGNPWGDCLHASNVHWLGLSYTTVLCPGIYTVNLNVRVANIVSLMPIRFRVDGTKYVAPLPSEFVPYTVLPESGPELEDYLDMMPMELCLGTINVSPTEQGKWPEVKFNIEDSGHMVNRKILFNYIYFELVTPQHRASCPSGWSLKKRRFKPDRKLRLAYEEFRNVKLQMMSVRGIDG